MTAGSPESSLSSACALGREYPEPEFALKLIEKGLTNRHSNRFAPYLAMMLASVSFALGFGIYLLLDI